MGDSARTGLRQVMPSLFNGIATAIAAAAGLIGLLHQTGYLGNHPRRRAGIEARASAHPHMLDENGPLAAADAPANAPASAGDSTAIATTAPVHRNLNGAWRDMGSNCHLIIQDGHELTVTSYDGGHGQAMGGRQRDRQGADGLGANQHHESGFARGRSDPVRRRPRIVGDDQGQEGRASRESGDYVGPSCVQTASRPD